MKVIILCHTEFGRVVNKQVVFDKRAIIGVTTGVRNLISIADKHNAKITFAVMPEVAKYFPKNINHEVGLHIHPGWEEYEAQGIKYIVGDNILKDYCEQLNDSTFLTMHTYKEQAEMIKTGRDYLQDVLGIVPKTHVAGRWAINEDTVKAIEECEITHDCSVIPQAKQPQYDYSQISRLCKPYYIRDIFYNRNTIIEIPISQSYPAGNASPESIGLLKLKLTFLEHLIRNQPVFHICLHSPSMADDYYISYMDNLLKFISKFNIEYSFASEIEVL